MKKVLFLVVLAIFSLSLLAPLSASAARILPKQRTWYDAIPLSLEAMAVNNHGQVAGRANDQAAVWYRGFLQQVNTGSPHSIALDINDKGTVLVMAWDKNYYRTSYFMVYKNGYVVHVYSPPYYYTSAEIYAINNRGQVVGDIRNESWQWQGIIWQNGQLTFVHLDSEYFGHMYMAGINDRGHFALSVYSEDSNSVQPFLGTPNGIVHLQVPANHGGMVMDLNNRDEAVGYYASYQNGQPGSRYPTVWLPDGQLRPLDSLGLQCEAIAVNNRGDILGEIKPKIASSTVVIWHNGCGAPVFLNDRLTKPLNVVSSNGINDRGEIICQAVKPSGSSGYFLLQPRYLRR